MQKDKKGTKDLQKIKEFSVKNPVKIRVSF